MGDETTMKRRKSNVRADTNLRYDIGIPQNYKNQRYKEV